MIIEKIINLFKKKESTSFNYPNEQKELDELLNMVNIKYDLRSIAIEFTKNIRFLETKYTGVSLIYPLEYYTNSLFPINLKIYSNINFTGKRIIINDNLLNIRLIKIRYEEDMNLNDYMIINIVSELINKEFEDYDTIEIGSFVELITFDPIEKMFSVFTNLIFKDKKKLKIRNRKLTEILKLI